MEIRADQYCRHSDHTRHPKIGEGFHDHRRQADNLHLLLGFHPDLGFRNRRTGQGQIMLYLGIGAVIKLLLDLEPDVVIGHGFAPLHGILADGFVVFSVIRYGAVSFPDHRSLQNVGNTDGAVSDGEGEQQPDEHQGPQAVLQFQTDLAFQNSPQGDDDQDHRRGCDDPFCHSLFSSSACCKIAYNSSISSLLSCCFRVMALMSILTLPW